MVREVKDSIQLHVWFNMYSLSLNLNRICKDLRFSVCTHVLKYATVEISLNHLHYYNTAITQLEDILIYCILRLGTISWRGGNIIYNEIKMIWGSCVPVVQLKVPNKVICYSWVSPLNYGSHSLVSLYTLYIMLRLRLGPENESLQNEVGRSIFTSKFVFVLVTKSTQQKPKTQWIFKIICFETSLPYRAIWPTDLVLMRLGKHYA